MLKYVILVFSLYSCLYAQFQIEAANTLRYDSNPFFLNNNDDISNNFVFQATYNLNKSWNLDINYSGEITNYKENSDKMDYINHLGISTKVNYDTALAKAKYIRFAVEALSQKYKNKYSSFDNISYLLKFKSRLPIGEQGKFGANYDFSYKKYSVDSIANYFNNRLSFQFEKYIIESTLLTLEANLGAKTYSSKLISQKSGKTQTKYSSLYQLTAGINIEQNIAENTDLALSYLRRQNLGGSKIKQLVAKFSADIDLWDDSFTYYGNEMELNIVQKITDHIEVEILNSYQLKSYDKTTVTSVKKGTREDKKYNFEFMFTLELGKVICFDNVFIECLVGRINNQSNSNSFNYNNNYASLSFDVTF